MKKNVPLYDVILVGILVVLAVYYLAVQGPIKTRTDELNIQKQQLEKDIATLQPSIDQKHAWEAELEKIYKKYNNNPVSIPDYDNVNNIINEMHIYLDGCDFSINYGDISLEDNIVTRDISITFTTKNYEIAKTKIEAIHDSTYKYQITDLSISNNNDGTCTCVISLIAHEYNVKGQL